MNSPTPAKKSQPEKIALAKEEWDFTACPPEQLKWCDVYEHLREDKEFLPEVESMRKLNMWSATALERFPSSKHAEIAKVFITLFPEFPDTPFLAINPTSRADRCMCMDQHRKTIAFKKTVITY